MKISLIFDDWRQLGKSIYNTEIGKMLSMEDFHRGAVFQGKIQLSQEDEVELKNALQDGYQPVFWVLIDPEIW